MYCWNCGTHIMDSATFCPKCGKQQGTERSEPGEDPLMRAIRPYYPFAVAAVAASLLEMPQVRLARSRLAPDEIPEGVIFAKHPKTGAGGGGLWATNRRLLYAGTNFWEKPIVEEYAYGQIRTIATSADGSMLCIEYSGRTIVLKGIDKRALLPAFISLVRKKMAAG